LLFFPNFVLYIANKGDFDQAYIFLLHSVLLGRTQDRYAHTKLEHVF